MFRYRFEAVKSGELLPTGEDVDLEQHFQNLPLQKHWLLQQEFTFTSFNDIEWLEKAMTAIRSLKDEVLTYLATRSKWIRSEEELYIGSALLLLENGPLLKHILKRSPASRRRLSGKQTSPEIIKWTVQHFVLRVLSFASLLCLTEDWHHTDQPGEKRLPCVSNMDSARIRAMGRLVEEESTLSSLPLISHVCAMCGHLLHPPTMYMRTPKDIGRPGPACQVQGKALPGKWDAMPLFLLLWSKRKLASSLKSVFTYDTTTNTLTLTRGIASAPWLNFVSTNNKAASKNLPLRENGQKQLCEKNPWWYCNTCYQYWLPASDSGDCFILSRIRYLRGKKIHTLLPRLVCHGPRR